MQLALTDVVTWPSFWDRLPKKPEPEVLRALLSAVAARDHHMRAALANVRAGVSLHAARRLQRRYLLSASAKLAALSRAWQARICGLIHAESARYDVALKRVTKPIIAASAGRTLSIEIAKVVAAAQADLG